MEQRKSDINTGDGNVVNVDTNGLSYSFDFSNQVDNTQQAVQPTVQAEPAPAAQVEPVQPEMAPQAVQPEVQAQPAVQAEPVKPEATVQAEQVQSAPAVQAEVTQTEQVKASEDNGENLIKDKKSTKFFLIVLFVLVISFIICLPMIHEIISKLI